MSMKLRFSSIRKYELHYYSAVSLQSRQTFKISCHFFGATFCFHNLQCQKFHVRNNHTKLKFGVIIVLSIHRNATKLKSFCMYSFVTKSSPIYIFNFHILQLAFCVTYKNITKTTRKHIFLVFNWYQAHYCPLKDLKNN